MALPREGLIKLSDVAEEFDIEFEDNSTSIDFSFPYYMTEFYAGGVFVPEGTESDPAIGDPEPIPTSGRIFLTNFYGASAFHRRRKSFYRLASTLPAKPTYTDKNAWTATNVQGWIPSPIPKPTTSQSVYIVELTQEYRTATFEPNSFVKNVWGEVEVFKNALLSVTILGRTTGEPVSDTIALTAQVNGGEPPYSYQWGGFRSGTGDELIVIGDQEGTVTITLEVTDEEGNTASDSHQITFTNTASSRIRVLFQLGGVNDAEPSQPSGGGYSAWNGFGSWVSTELFPTATRSVFCVDLIQSFAVEDGGQYLPANFEDNQWLNVFNCKPATGHVRSITFYQRSTSRPDQPTGGGFAAYSSPPSGWGTDSTLISSTTEAVYSVTLTQTFSSSTIDSTTWLSNDWSIVSIFKARSLPDAEAPTVSIAGETRAPIGSSVALTVSYSGGAYDGTPTITWGGGASGSASTASVTSSGAGDVEATVEVAVVGTGTNAKANTSDTAEASHTVDFHGGLAVAIAGGGTDFQPNISYLFTAIASGGTPPYTYAWGDSVSGTGETTRFIVTDEGTYTISVVVTDADGNTASDSIQQVITEQSGDNERLYDYWMLSGDAIPSAPGVQTFNLPDTISGWSRVWDPAPEPTVTLNLWGVIVEQIFSDTDGEDFDSRDFVRNRWGTPRIIKDKTGGMNRSKTFYQRASTKPSAPSGGGFSSYERPPGSWTESPLAATTSEAVYAVGLTQFFTSTTFNGDTFVRNEWGSVSEHQARLRCSVSISASPGTIVPVGTSVTLSAAVSGETGPIEYRWTGGGRTSSITVSMDSEGSGNYSVSIRRGACISSSSITIMWGGGCVYSDWSAYGPFSDWGPATSTVATGVMFTQTRTRTRTRTLTSGVVLLCTDLSEDDVEERPATGTGATACSYSDWSAYGPWSAWSPARSTVAAGVQFMQTRTRTRTRTLEAGPAATCTDLSDEDEGTRTTTGTATGPGACDYSSWSAYGAWSGWSPATSTVDAGTTFTQTRTRTRTRTLVSGSAATCTDLIDIDSDDREATGTRPVTPTCSYSAWSAFGAYGAWTPSTDTVDQGVTFTQSRFRTRTRTLVSGSSTTCTDLSDTDEDTRMATGTKPPACNCTDWVGGATTTTTSDWSDCVNNSRSRTHVTSRNYTRTCTPSGCAITSEDRETGTITETEGCTVTVPCNCGGWVEGPPTEDDPPYSDCLFGSQFRVVTITRTDTRVCTPSACDDESRNVSVDFRTETREC